MKFKATVNLVVDPEEWSSFNEIELSNEDIRSVLQEALDNFLDNGVNTYGIEKAVISNVREVP